MKRNRLIIPAAVLVIVVALVFADMERKAQNPDAQLRTGQCTVGIYCDTVLENMTLLAEEKHSLIPQDGKIVAPRLAAFAPGESAFEVLERLLREEGIHMEYSGAKAAGTAYIRGIGTLYEFDCGAGSGWLYYVNRDDPGVGALEYEVQEGDVLEWIYSCDFGEDVSLLPLAS